MENLEKDINRKKKKMHERRRRVESEEFAERFMGTFGDEVGLDDEEYFENIREEFAERLEDLVTDPEFSGMDLDTDIPEDIRAGQKIESDNLVSGVLVRLGQDLKLSPDEIDELRNRFFKS